MLDLIQDLIGTVPDEFYPMAWIIAAAFGFKLIESLFTLFKEVTHI